LPQNYDRFIVLSTYANSDGLISLIEAREKKDLMDPKAAKARAFFIVTSKDDGSSTVPLQLDLKFTPRKLASLASGRFVILGIDDANITPILATLNSDGTLFRILDFDSRKYNKDSALKGVFNDQGATNSVTQRHMLAAVSFSMFVPFGSGVLFVQPASNLPARLIGDYGELKEVRFSTPAGYLMHDILVSDTKRPLVARLESEADLRSFAEKHVSENPDQILAEFSRDSGQLVRYIRVKGPQPGEISCATDNELTAIYFPEAKDSDKAPDQLIFATAPM